MKKAALVFVFLAAGYAFGQPLELQLPRFSTPPVCDAGRLGRVYLDTDDNLVYWCNGTAWVSFSSLTISGTNPFVARFNSAGTNIENSQLRNTGTAAAGASGDMFDLNNVAINAMNGSDTVVVMKLNVTNAAHSGAGNKLIGIQPGLVGSASANATETAYSIGSNWDFGIDFGLFKVLGNKPAAGTSGSYVDITDTPNAMDGGDTVDMLHIFPNTPGNHTGANNFLHGIRFNTMTPDADATEIAIYIRDGWDEGIRFENAFTNPLIFAENSGGASMTLYDATDTTPTVLFSGGGAPQVAFEAGSEITTLMGTDLAVVGAAQTVDPNANVVEISAGAAASVSIITAPTATSHTERVTFVCNGVNVTFNDADAAGAAGTLNLAGVATNFTCSGDDTLTFVYLVAPGAGNARWVEVSRSVN